jgi:alkylated DNA nucleotide flippase Atl1
VVSRGFAICSQKEMNRLRSDEYVLASMAQTRAIGKAYRNVIGWVMKLANYEPTPAEEIVNLGGKSVIEKEQELKEKQENMYEKILIVLGKENDIKRLEELKTKIETAKGLTEEQKGQLLDFVNSKIDAIKNNQK